MKRNPAARILFATARMHCALLCFFIFTGTSHAQSAPQSGATVSVLLVSDIHFEPFWDPAKTPQLAAAPVSQWDAILSATPSPDRQQRFTALQLSCHTRGTDTSYPLFNSSLMAMRARDAHAGFVTVSGDLLSHAFPCKFNALFAQSTPQAYSAFVQKTLDFVIGELDSAFPNIPVYVALGNNDTDCGDYRLDAYSQFLAASGNKVASDLPVADRPAALASFASGGYYSASLPAPIPNARILVLNDIFMSSSYRTCAGKSDPAAADAQLAWLRRQLAEARADKQKLWVMGHIPPGIDLYSTAKQFIDVCGGQTPVMYLSTENLAGLLVEYSDVVQLAIFAHTHMDEIRLLKNDDQSAHTVAVKLIASISPVDGNIPSFTVAQIDPASAALKNYQVFAASNHKGLDNQWTEEYDFARSFHKADFSASSLSELVNGFAADPTAKTPASQSYIQDYSLGFLSPVLQAFWPQYLCSVSNHTQQSFKACACAATR